MQTEAATQIERIVEEAIRLSADGKAVDYAAYTSAHPELMPELGKRLSLLQAVEDAEKEVRSSASSGGAEIPPDIEFLAGSFPDYEILERIERGGQGVVYRARQRFSNRSVAIKMLLNGAVSSASQRRRFAREIELAARLKHPNLVGVIAGGEIDGRAYVVMEHIHGLAIDEHVFVNELSTRDTVSLFISVCEAINAAHQGGVLHRDVKPANILVDAEGVPHVLDFGFAKDLDASASDAGVTVSGDVLGTPAYTSPEQALGASDRVDIRADIYSLGVVLYYLLSGGFPYPVDGNVRTVLTNIALYQPRRFQDAYKTPAATDRRVCVEADLESVVLKALQKDPAARYQSTGAFADDLKRYLRGEAVEAKAASGFYQLRKAIHRYRLQAGVALAFLLLLCGAAVGTSILWQRAERGGRIAMTGLQMASLVN
ncbi:MAG: serine/threonine protein kinase, partial [Phycisphaerales bacterium]